MAITKSIQESNISSLEETKGIKFICPVCKSEKLLQFPKSIVTQAKGLTTMSIAKGLVCEHQFQAFVDKNYMVRGYQRVDFEFEKAKTNEKKLQTKDSKVEDNDIFQNLILEEDYLEYNPRQKIENNLQRPSRIKTKSLQEIYNEFWEFIDDENEKFKKFIRNDPRRSISKSF